eukprot:CAMPEP_0172358672 /NCGR_PEP_ID=MMETSP1060-20121228/2963_1 /TAXON_ID=37318 /ORGANISM="Pseudo-nitzschia pungens, Strain cf. cingulata" /LENGTH=113 /DNA_ID=CAMNT_0013079989 /DNA_START=310 /DNA_END=651 /DNA_ORIENTATION=-
MSTFQVASRRFFVPALRRSSVVVNTSRRTMMAFEDHARLRGKFEEDRYLKQQEDKWCEKLRALRAQEESARVKSQHDEVVEPVKKHLAEILAETGDEISDAGLENLAKFRLSL